MKDILKIVKSIEDSGFLEGVSGRIKNEAKEQKRRIYQYVIRYVKCKFIGRYLSG